MQNIQIMRFLLTFFFYISIFSLSYSQLSDGSDAPDFDLEDLDGVSHVLYDYLEDGKGAILDFSATWCPPCWSYHNTGTLESVWNTYGPSGSNETMVFFIEPDPTTSQACIYGPSGCSGGALGDWTDGVDYPILNPNSADATSVNNDFNINYYPTLYAVGPNYKIYETGQISVSEWGDWVESFSLEADYEIVANDGCSYADVEINASGGHGNLSYSWSNGESGSVLEDVQPGTYTIEISDNNNYKIEVGPIVVQEGNIISIGLDYLEPVSCYEEQDGYIQVYGINGTNNYSYEWDNGVETDYNDDLGPGDYTVLVTDTNTGCTAEETYTIYEPDVFDAEVETIQADCSGQNGTLEIEVDGGVGNLVYFINGQPYYQPTIENLDAGYYSIFIRDALNCTVSLSTEIDQPLVPTVDTLMPDLITCNQQIISLSADSSSIGEHIIYTWNLDTTAIDTGYIIQTDTFGLFTLTVKDTLSTCSDDLSFIVSTDTLAPALIVTTPDNTLTCNLSSTTLQGVASTEDVTYSWTTEQQEVIGMDSSVVVSTPGTYTGRATDTNNGCITSESITIVQNLETPTITLAEIINIDCENTSATLSVIDDQNAIYEWSADDGSVVGSGATLSVDTEGQYNLSSTSLMTGCTSYQVYEVMSTTDVPQVSISTPLTLTCDQESTVLQANDEVGYSYEWLDDQGDVVSEASTYEAANPGDFTLRVTDNSNGCSNVTTVSVEQDIKQPEIVLENKGSLDCIDVETNIVVESKMNHSYTWTTNNGEIVNGDDANEVRVSSAGNYKLVMTNTITGCTSQKSYNVTEDSTSPDVDIAEADLLTCAIGQITLSADENDTFTYEWTTNDGSTVGAKNKSTLKVNAPGTYNLLTTSTENGCISNQSIKVEENVEEPIIEVLDVGSVDCSGANAVITLSADSNYEYQWTTASGSIIGVNKGSSLEVDKAGLYTVTAINQSNGCTSSEMIEVIYSQAPPTIEVTGEVLICAGASSTLCMTTTGGDTQWYVDGNLIGSEECVQISQASTVEAVSTNQLGCSSSSIIAVEEYMFPTFTTTGDQQQLDCVTPSVTLGYEIEGGFSATWANGNATVISDTETADVTAPGTYTLTLTNNQTGCAESKTVEVTQDETTLPTFELTTDGNLTQQFSYDSDQIVDSQLWSFGDGVTSAEANPIYTYIIPGYYEVCLTTTNKCGDHTECSQILAAEPIGITDEVADPICYHGTEGVINVNLVDGLEPYTVMWTGPNGYTAEGQSITDLVAGDYEATVTDAGITEEILQFTLTQPVEIEVVSETVTEETIGLADGAISIDAIGGTGDLSYEWNHGPTTPTITDLEAGDYSVMIMDENGCTITMDYTVGGVVSNVNDFAGLDQFDVSPNPTTGLVTVSIEMTQRQDLNLSLLDITGRVYYTFDISNRSEILQLDFTDFSEGVYMMRLTNGTQVSSRPIVIVR